MTARIVTEHDRGVRYVLRRTSPRVERTPQGCIVETTRERELATGLVHEKITVSHPRPLIEVAFSPGEVLERAARV